jgi:hypothetical protein
MSRRTRALLRVVLPAALALTALGGVTAPSASALSCPAGTRYATTGDVKNNFTPAVVVHINWCWNPTTFKVVSHEWYRNAINGNGWNFHSYAPPAQTGGNGQSFYKFNQTGYFWGGRWLCVNNAVSVNGRGNWAQEGNSWVYC